MSLDGIKGTNSKKQKIILGGGADFDAKNNKKTNLVSSKKISFGGSNNLVNSSTVGILSNSSPIIEVINNSAQVVENIEANIEKATDEIKITSMIAAKSASDSANTLWNRLQTFISVINAYLGYLLNNAAYKSYVFLVSSYEYVLDTPNHINTISSKTHNLYRILIDSKSRALWLFDKKLEVIFLAKKISRSIAVFKAFMQHFYMAVFVVMALSFLAFASVTTDTSRSSTLSTFVDQNTVVGPELELSNSVTDNNLLTAALEFNPPSKSLILEHTVRDSDDVKKLASLYNVSEQTILFNNNLEEIDEEDHDDHSDHSHGISAGQKIYIPSTDAYIYFADSDIELEELARIYEVETDSILEFNENLVGEKDVKKGSLVVVPLTDFAKVTDLNEKENARIAKLKAEEEAQKKAEIEEKKAEEERIAYEAELAKQYEERLAALQTTSEAVSFSAPESQRVDSGFVYPVIGGSFTSGYHGGHLGIDISYSNPANKYLPIYAASAGVVTEVKDGCYCPQTPAYGFGNYIKIDHGGGVSTLYAHLSDGVSVYPGQTVSTGQQIGVMGNAGWSVGSDGIHLHFEVFQNGYQVNPYIYLP